MSNWDSSKNPRKYTLQNAWDYSTRNGIFEEEGCPLEGFSTAHQYLLIEKKEAEDDSEPTYWGTTHDDISSLRSYVKTCGFYEQGKWANTGWKVVYVFDLDADTPLQTQTAFSD
jgi:hypothetical protein